MSSDQRERIDMLANADTNGMRGGKKTEMKRSGERREHEVRMNMRSLRGGGQQDERKEGDGKLCEMRVRTQAAWEETQLRIEELREPKQGTIDQTKTSSRAGVRKQKLDLALIDMIEHHEEDDLAVQETRLKKELEPSATNWAKRRGYSVTAEKCTTRSAGSDDAGVCIILSKFLVQQAQRSGNVLIEGREGRVCCTGRQVQYNLFLVLASMGEDYVAIGDWNRTVDEDSYGHVHR